MKYSKEINGEEVVLDEPNPNFHSILEREGFKPVKEVKEKPKLDKK